MGSVCLQSTENRVTDTVDGQRNASSSSKAPRFMADLCDFWSLRNAKANVITDAKIDDAIFLWYFFLFNLARPANHNVTVQVLIAGITDRAAAVCLVQHLWECVKQHVSRGLEKAANVTVNVYASKVSVEKTPRHELDTYRPYNDGTAGFPQAVKEPSALSYWSDMPASNFQADLIWVLCQFFNCEVLVRDATGEKVPKLGMLDYILPRHGGLVAFQYGFNTTIISGSQQHYSMIWDTLVSKVHEVGGHIAVVSNTFSFDKDSGKPGTALVNEPFLGKLRAGSASLWDHLLEAGLKEALLFATDQMAVWLALEPQTGVDYEKDGLGSSLKSIVNEKQIPLGTKTEISMYLKDTFVQLQANLSPGQKNPICEIAEEMHSLVKSTAGERPADYLGRAVGNFGKYGKSIECTDGLHAVALMQCEQAVLWPVKLTEDPPHLMKVEFGVGTDAVLWAVRGVNVPLSLQWLNRALEVPSLVVPDGRDIRS